MDTLAPATVDVPLLLAQLRALPRRITADSRRIEPGVAFAAYLLYVQLAVINAVCEWCLVSDALVTVLAVLTLLRLRGPD